MSDYYKLLPCPFCGGEATVMFDPSVSEYNPYCCFCLDCEAAFYGGTDDEVVQNWNNRANTHIKIQYHDEELTVQEICERLERAEKAKHSLITFLNGSCRACVKRFDCDNRKGSHKRCWKFDYSLIEKG